MNASFETIARDTQPPFCILICDDEPDIVNALRIYLEREGYDTLCAYDGAQALELLRSHSVDLILLDCMMPRMDGFTALSHIRENSNVPVIFLTPRPRSRTSSQGLRAARTTTSPSPFARPS